MKKLTEKELLAVNGGITTPFHWDGGANPGGDIGGEIGGDIGGEFGCDASLPPGGYTSIFTGVTTIGCDDGSGWNYKGSGGGSDSESSNPITCYREGNVTVVTNMGRGRRCKFEP